VAVVIPLKLVYTPVDDTVTAIRNYQVPSTKYGPQCACWSSEEAGKTAVEEETADRKAATKPPQGGGKGKRGRHNCRGRAVSRATMPPTGLSNKQANDYFAALGYEALPSPRRLLLPQQVHHRLGVCSGYSIAWRPHHGSSPRLCSSPPAAPTPRRRSLRWADLN
jgi:hypothetical protein